ncbi:MAG TPA: hypothetical protein VFH54_04940, partial [Mycobacteriales bacterium]|nr:hypothetical protein [Mycobacteriales bacterium]
ARWLQAPAVGALLASYGVVVAAVSPHSIGQVALVGLLGVGLSVVLLRADVLLPPAATATAKVGGAVGLAVCVAASIAGADGSVLAMWCGIVLGASAAALMPPRETAAGGGLLVAAMLLLGHVMRVESSPLATACAAAAALGLVLLPTRWAWQPRLMWFVLGGGVLVEAVAQVAMQATAGQGRELSRASVGLVVVVLLAMAAMAWSWSRSAEAASAFAVAATFAVVGATAEALGGSGASAAAEGAAIVAGMICVLAVAVAAAGARAEAMVGAAVACASGLGTSIATGIALALHHVATVEAYIVAPGMVCAAIGIVAMARLASVSSWALLPTAVVALGPTLLLALRHDLDRQVVVLVVGAVLVALGAQLRLVCPIAVGTTALLVVAARMLGPEIVQLPRWLTLSIIGAALITLGATWERRLQDMRNAAERVRPVIAALR